jgi:hypothetical protein
MRKVFVVLVVGALLVAAALITRAASAGAPPLVGASEATAETGEHGTVELYAQEFADPGLGAWTIDLRYDPDVISIASCTPVAQTSVCNAEYADGIVRSAGANAQGIIGDTVIAEIVFECADDEGSTELEVLPRDVADATIGGPQLLTVDLSDGMVTCEAGEEEPPPAGGTPTATRTPAPLMPDAGNGGPGMPSGVPIALALLGVLASGVVIFGAAERLFPRRLG